MGFRDRAPSIKVGFVSLGGGSLSGEPTADGACTVTQGWRPGASTADTALRAVAGQVTHERRVVAVTLSGAVRGAARDTCGAGAETPFTSAL